MSTVDDYGNECGECAAELDSLRAQLLAAENAAANAVQSRNDWQSIADFARTERDSFRAEVEALRAEVEALRKQLAAAEQRAAGVLTAIAAFNLNGVAPRDKLGAALDCIASIKRALEG